MLSVSVIIINFKEGQRTDFKEVDGISVPFKQVTSMEQGELTMEVDSIKFNEEISASKFKLPTSIQKLVDDK